MGGIIEKLEKLKEAEEIFERAKDACNMARSEETAALNRLNEAQRSFDAEVDTVRNDSPGGDWSRL